MTRRTNPTIIDNQLHLFDPAGGALPPIVVGAAEWYRWLDDPAQHSFALHTADGAITMRRERKRNGWYWYAYRKRGGKLRKMYVGKSAELSPARLAEVVQSLTGPPEDAAPPAAETLRLELLGQPRVLRAGQPVLLSTAKALALLAYLAVTGVPQRREQILALLWPDSAAEAARKNLRNTLWAIRAALGPSALHVDDRLALDAALEVDLREWEQVVRVRPSGATPGSAEWQRAVAGSEAALADPRGALLDGLTLADAPEFELWLTGERERLRQLELRAHQQLVDAYRSAQRWPQVLMAARRALAFDPLQEGMYRALMEAHARLGERAEALRQYETLRAALSQELGVTPLPATEELRSAIVGGLIQPPEGASCQQRAESSSPPIAQVRRREAATTPFVGRAAELAALDAELAAAEGAAHVVLVTGEVGIGKSRLWQAWADRLGPARRVLQTRCAEATAALPFAPLISLFSGLPCQERLGGPEPPLPPQWLAEIARLVPDLRQRVPNLPALPVLPPEEERRRLFEALVQGLRVMAARPLILVLDDAQWADRATLEWIGYLVERLHDQPLLLLLAYRAEDAPAALVRLVAQWGRQGSVRRVTLPRFTPDESATLVAALDGDARRSVQLHAASAGNPYFLSELIRAAPDEMPPALTDLIRAQLDGLPDPARQVLQAAAVLDPEIDFALLREISGRGEDETLDALDALLAAAVLAEQGAHYSFVHPLVATVVQRGMSAARRAVLHRRAAELRAAAQSQRLPAIAGQLVRHYQAAGDVQQAAASAELAAEHALTLAAPDEAITFYRQAIALQPTPGRWMGLGQTLFRQGELDGAQAAFEAAWRGFDAARDRRGMTRASLSLTETAMAAGRPEDARRWGERTLADLQQEDDPAARALVHFLFGANPLVGGQPLDRAETHLTKAGHLALEHGLTELAARSRFTLGNLQAERGDLQAALHSYRETIRLAQVAGDQFQEVLAHNNAAYHALLLGDHAAAHAHVAAGLALTEARALRLPQQYLYSTRGEIALAERQWAEAEQWFTRGLAEAQRHSNAPQIANYRANLGLAARGRGDLDGAVLLLETAREAAARLPASHLQSRIDLWLTELYAERGEAAAAEDALRRAESRLTEGDYQQLRAWAARLRRQLTPIANHA